MAGRFVAGESLDDAIEVACELDARGARAMLDHLGENVRTADQATAATEDYLAAVRRIRETPGLDGAISVS